MTDLQVVDSTLSIASLIPHRPPMQLLDRVIAAGSERLLASAELQPGAPFYGPAGVAACIGLEYLGQSAAAFFSARGAENSERQRPAPRPGMLIASRSYRCQHGYFPACSQLLIDISPTSAIGSAGLVKFSGTIHVLTATEALGNALPKITAATLPGLCDFLQQEPPFAEGDLSVYLPPADSEAVANQT